MPHRSQRVVDTPTRFKNRVVVVVGGASGIGEASAVRLASEGGHIVVADVAQERAAKVAQSIVESGGVAVSCTCDIGDAQQVEDLFLFAVSTFGGVDAVHVNAADVSLSSRDTDVVSVGLDVFDRAVEINLRGHVLTARNALPLMLDRGGGSIVFTGSRAGLTSEPVRVSYAITKSGLHALSRHIALRWGRDGIRSNVLAPGTVLTDPLRALGSDFVQARLVATPSPRLGTAQDIAAGVAYLLSDDAAFVNGQILSVDGGATMR